MAKVVFEFPPEGSVGLVVCRDRIVPHQYILSSVADFDATAYRRPYPISQTAQDAAVAEAVDQADRAGIDIVYVIAG